MSKPQQVKFYRQSSSGAGCAFSFQISLKQVQKGDYVDDIYMMFLETAKQLGKNDNGNATYDWENKITVKLGPNDVGEILAVLAGRKESVGTKGNLYHQTPGGGSKIIDLKSSDKGYEMAISAQDADKNLSKAYICLNDAEAEILCTVLRHGLVLMYNW